MFRKTPRPRAAAPWIAASYGAHPAAGYAFGSSALEGFPPCARARHEIEILTTSAPRPRISSSVALRVASPEAITLASSWMIESWVERALAQVGRAAKTARQSVRTTGRRVFIGVPNWLAGIGLRCLAPRQRWYVSLVTNLREGKTTWG